MSNTHLLTFFLALTVACGEAVPEPLPLGQAASWSTLELSMTQPVVTGGPLDLSVTGAIAGDHVWLIRSDGGLGQGGCPSVLLGACMDITPGTTGYQPTLDAIADANGEVSWSFGAFPSVRPSPLAVQAVVVNGGQTYVSNAIATEVVEPCAPDAFEDNDDMANAHPIAPGAFTDLSVCEADDHDWYVVRVPPATTVSLAMEFDNDGEGDLDMYLYDASGAEVGRSVSLRDREEVNFPNTTGAPVDVFLDILLYDDVLGQRGVPYTLTTTLAAASPCATDAFEPNNEPATASLIPPGSFDALTCAWSSDWYSFQASAGDLIDVRTPNDGPLPLDTVLYDPAGEELTLLRSVIDGYQTTAPLDGLYALEVLPVGEDGDVSTAYTLELDVTTLAPCLDDASEPDDDLASAMLLGTPATVAQTACALDSDWFAVDVLPNEVLRVDASGDSDERLFLFLYDDTGALVETPEQGNRSMNYNTLQSERLYVEVGLVADDPAGEGADYELSVNRLPRSSCEVDAYEPNDTMATAAVVSSGNVRGHSCIEDPDWFAFDALEGQVITVDPALNTLGQVRVWDASGSLLHSERLQWPAIYFFAEQDGRLFVEIDVTYDGPTGGGEPYVLIMSTRDPLVCPTDVFEPDNHPLTATPIGDGIHDAQSCNADPDWYRFSVAAPGPIYVGTERDLPYVTTRLYDSAGSLLAEDDAISYEATAPGDFFVEVELEQRPVFGGGVPYMLNLYTGDPSCTPDLWEPNDARASAAPLGAGRYDLKSCPAEDADWFKVDLLAGETLKVHAAFHDAEGNLDLYLYNDEATQTYVSSNSRTDDEMLTYVASQDETVRLLVHPRHDDGGFEGNRYQLDLVVY